MLIWFNRLIIFYYYITYRYRPSLNKFVYFINNHYFYMKGTKCFSWTLYALLYQTNAIQCGNIVNNNMTILPCLSSHFQWTTEVLCVHFIPHTISIGPLSFPSRVKRDDMATQLCWENTEHQQTSTRSSNHHTSCLKPSPSLAKTANFLLSTYFLFYYIFSTLPLIKLEGKMSNLAYFLYLNLLDCQ